VRLDLGRRGLDAPRVDDRAEFQARRVVVDVLGWIGLGVGGWRNRDQDVDLHVVGSVSADGERRRKMGGEAPGEISGYGSASDAC